MVSESLEFHPPPELSVPKTIEHQFNFEDQSNRKKICRESVADTATVASTHSGSAFSGSSSNSSKGTGRIKVDVTEVAGARLYYQAVQLSKKLENRRAKELTNYSYKAPTKKFSKTFPKEPQRGTLRKSRSVLPPVSETSVTSKLKKPTNKQEVLRGKSCANRLYGLSKKQQEIGKKRREEIAEKLKKKNSLPLNRDYGTLSLDRASDMYLKGQRKVQQREARLQSLRKRVEDQIKRNQEFKLAEGAFAKIQDPDFQERIHNNRYGNMHEFREDQENTCIADSTINIENSTIASQSVFTNFPPDCLDAVDHVPSSIAGGSTVISYVSNPSESHKYPQKLQQARDILISQRTALHQRNISRRS